jgi:hypothetical protein
VKILNHIFKNQNDKDIKQKYDININF